MNYIFKGETIDYEFFNNSHKDTILFLHGWGGNKKAFSSCFSIVKNNFNYLTISIPTIMDTNFVWDMFDYRDLVLNILKLHNLDKIIIVCHSFGFRIATLLHNHIKIKKLIITGGAGMKRKNIIKRIENENNLILLKDKKYEYLFKKISSPDYQNLSNTNKKTFKNIVNFNTKNLVKFDCPILLFWGKNDTETLLWIAKKLYKLNRSLLFITKSDHFAYLKENFAFNHELKKFLME